MAETLPETEVFAHCTISQHDWGSYLPPLSHTCSFIVHLDRTGVPKGEESPYAELQSPPQFISTRCHIPAMTAGDLLTRLRTAIKEPHASIHRLNLSRIPLCLPPHTEGPGLYIFGLSRYAEIFYGLEEAWISLIGDPMEWLSQDVDTEITHFKQSIDSTGASVHAESRIQAVLRSMYMPELLRSRALEEDLRFLTASSDCPLGTPTLHDLEESSSLETRFGRDEIRQRIQDQPHLLVAYVWIMYSALLYGGRDIRALLLKAGAEFWGLSAREIAAPRGMPCPLSFWHFGDDDGSAVKGRFRARMVDVEGALNAREQQDILDEVIKIFGTMEILTKGLDKDAKIANVGA